MEFLIKPNIAHIIVVTTILLLFTTLLYPKLSILKVLAGLFLVLSFYELFQLKANFWALALATFSVLPFMVAIRQTEMRLPLVALTILMLVVGSVFLFTNDDGQPIDLRVSGIISIFCAEFIWISVKREVNKNNPGRGPDPNSVVGLIGEAYTDIHEFGSVRVADEIRQAHSEKFIPTGSTVRVLKDEGFTLFVKKVEKLTKE
ncbi:MAG TPA: NfeD family protein [Anaerolineales bacterium]|nr:NfeD family protein [Anaerolineales bacterium]